MNKKTSIGVFSFSIVLLVLLGPLLKDHFDILAGRRHYQWFPILLVLVPVLFFMQWRKAVQVENKPKDWTLIILGLCALLMTAVAYLYFTGWVAVWQQ